MTALDRLSAALRDIDCDSFASKEERLKAEDLLRSALHKVQSPWDITWAHNWVHPTTHAAIKTLIDAGVFKKWAEHGSQPATSSKLAELTNTDPALIARLVRHLAAQHLLVETAEDMYMPTPWATTLGTDPALPSCYGSFYKDINNGMAREVPEFLKKTGYKNPTDDKNGVVQHMFGPDVSFFGYVAFDPVLTKEMRDAMECHSKWNLTAWTELFPTETLLKDAKPGQPIVVDVGGSKGHDLEKFRLKHPEVPRGSLVLQDLPTVLQDLETPHESIVKCPYDFFTPQPLRGARAYVMHVVLHDWPNEPATTMLRNVADAMEKGYSKLLIHESMVDNINPPSRVTTSDMTMLINLSAAERTVKEWHELIATAGLKVVKIWKRPAAVDGVIEVELI
ncbi:S-adenosyl-L-methionine-dependent methyltransferase [Hypoxylon cercidicola]|nr:S-adenosyl-L-methionine-dependent methyltransferase [Hypoxylon cercidicola]